MISLAQGSALGSATPCKGKSPHNTLRFNAFAIS